MIARGFSTRWNYQLVALAFITSPTSVFAETLYPEPATYYWVQGGNIQPYALPLQSPSNFDSLETAIADIQKQFSSNAEAICRTNPQTGWSLVSYRFEVVPGNSQGQQGGVNAYCKIQSLTWGDIVEVPSIGFQLGYYCDVTSRAGDATFPGHVICFYLQSKALNIGRGCSVRQGLHLMSGEVNYSLLNGSAPIPIFYSSQSEVDIGLGMGWNSDWSVSVQAQSTDEGAWAFVRRSTGRVIAFQRVAGAWSTPLPSDGVLVSTVNAQTGEIIWQYHRRDDAIESYASDGRLLTIDERSDRKTTFTYGIEGELIRVESNWGESWDLTYEGIHVASISDQTGRVWSFSYDDAGNLIEVRQPGATPSSDDDNPALQFAYNEPKQTNGANLPNKLTGVVDERGTRLLTYSYQTDGRVSNSYAGEGVRTVSVSYDDVNGSRVLQNALGQTSSYSTALVNGIRITADITGNCSQ